jgi:cytochrome c553
MPMLITSMADMLSASDRVDIGAYMEHLAVPAAHRRAILRAPGNSAAGEKVYINEECDGCHEKDGSGNSRKNIPPLRGQHTDYLMKQMHDFKQILRIHDGEEEKDESSFAELDDTMLRDLVAYLSTLDD